MHYLRRDHRITAAEIREPAVPISVAEQVESTQEAFEAGASIVHCHVRDDDGQPSSDLERFARLQEGIRKHCPGMILQFSTGGQSGTGSARGGMLPLKPDMASLAVGSNNFPTRVYENPPELVDWLASRMIAYDIKPEIEVFDLSHLFKAAEMVREGKIKDAPYVQFVMGVKNAMPADRGVFDFYVRTTARILPGALWWCAAGIGRHQIELNEWCIAAEAADGMCAFPEISRRLTLHDFQQRVVVKFANVCRQVARLKHGWNHQVGVSAWPRQGHC